MRVERIDTRTDPDRVGDEVPAWDRLLDGDESALDDLTDEERQRLAKFAKGGFAVVYDHT